MQWAETYLSVSSEGCDERLVSQCAHTNFLQCENSDQCKLLTGENCVNPTGKLCTSLSRSRWWFLGRSYRESSTLGELVPVGGWCVNGVRVRLQPDKETLLIDPRGARARVHVCTFEHGESQLPCAQHARVESEYAWWRGVVVVIVA